MASRSNSEHSQSQPPALIISEASYDLSEIIRQGSTDSLRPSHSFNDLMRTTPRSNGGSAVSPLVFNDRRTSMGVQSRTTSQGTVSSDGHPPSWRQSLNFSSLLRAFQTSPVSADPGRYRFPSTPTSVVATAPSGRRRDRLVSFELESSGEEQPSVYEHGGPWGDVLPYDVTISYLFDYNV